MTDKTFVDSNVFLYVLDKRDRKKSEQAESLLRSVIKAQIGVVSTQVINEFVNIAIYKFNIDATQVKKAIRVFNNFSVVVHSVLMTSAAIDIQDRYSISFWDAMIVAAAASAGCKTICTEDLSHGQKIAGIKIVNPFT